VTRYIYTRCTSGYNFRIYPFKFFIKDIFYFIFDNSLYNYADDNTFITFWLWLKYYHQHLGKDSPNLIDWFTSNQMKANPDKFQTIAVGKNTQSKKILLLI